MVAKAPIRLLTHLLLLCWEGRPALGAFLRRLEAGPCIWDRPGGEELQCPKAADESAVLLAISGMRSRMLFNTTVERVVAPLAREGRPVHVYISLVGAKDDHPFMDLRRLERMDPAAAHLTHPELRRYYSQMVAKAGGCLVCFSISAQSESLPTVPSGYPWQRRMYQYLPHDNSVGRNVLRLWKSREKLWEYGLQAERQLKVHYSLAMWARDDARWVADVVDAAPLLATPGAARSVWTKDCKEWFGINDKVALMGREAADVMMRAWSSYWKPRPMLDSQNAEQYLQRLAQTSGLSLRKLSQAKLPTGDAMFVGGASPFCFVKKYWCGDPDVSFCEDLSSSWS